LGKYYRDYSRLEKKYILSIFIATYIHHRITIIHPFTDGNGRLARLIMATVLASQGFARSTFPPSLNHVILDKRTEYLNCLNKADKGNYFPFMEFLIRSLNRSYKLTTDLIDDDKK
jgi:Fic family protein